MLTVWKESEIGAANSSLGGGKGDPQRKKAGLTHQPYLPTYCFPVYLCL